MKTLITSIFLLVAIVGFAQDGQKTVDETIDLLRSQMEVYYLEITEEMFNMFFQSPEIKNKQWQDGNDEFHVIMKYLTNLSRIKMIQTTNNIDTRNLNLYENFLKGTNLKNFKRLMVSEDPDNKLAFYKKKKENNENEFLLVSSEAVILLAGQIDLKSLREFEQILEMAGETFDL